MSLISSNGGRVLCASFVNVELVDGEPQNGAGSRLATVLLENPAGENRLTVEQLHTEVQVRRLRDATSCW